MGSSRSQQRRRVTSDDGLVIAIELVVTPLLFAVAGFGLDTWLGTRPWFTAILGIVAFTGKVVSEWYRYSSRMDSHQAEIIDNRPTRSRGLRRLTDASATKSGIPTGATLETSPTTLTTSTHSASAPDQSA